MLFPPPSPPASEALAFGHVERLLRAYLASLFNLRPLIRAASASLPDMPRRASFDGGIIRLPERFAGVPDAEARRLFMASAAHVGAHLAFSRPFERGGLKPVQIALVSLIEDARVEHLAMAQLRGLARLWRPFHAPQEPGGPRIATAMMAALASALMVQDDVVHDPWVAKGRDAFFSARDAWDDPDISRRIGVLLGNDLGQMRVQFNAKTYVVEPAYRDDNLGLWRADDALSETETPPEDLYEQVRIERGDSAEQGRERSPEEGGGNVQMKVADEDAGMPVARHAEWDYFAATLRPDWTTALEYEPRRGSIHTVQRIYNEHADVLGRIERLVRSARVSKAHRSRRQAMGDRLDLDAAIDAMRDLRTGHAPDPRVYESALLRGRDLSIVVLLDISESTRDFVEGTSTTVLSVERAATLLLAEAMAQSGDPFAVLGFCSNGRSESRIYRVKDFDDPFGPEQKERLAGLRSGFSTRMGAAIRHGTSYLRRRSSYRRLILVITDGEPSDIDVPDEKYLVEDARYAVQEAAHLGIDSFCVGLDPGGDHYLRRIFGRQNVVQIDRVARLPEKLPMLYLRLTR